jgi:hypothetical protein
MKDNTGGRNRFIRSSMVRYITIQGNVSSEEYIIDPDNSSDVIVADRKGLVLIKSHDRKKEFKVQSRRILPVDVSGKVPVIESGNKYRAVCNNCCNVLEIIVPTDAATCGRCTNSFPLFWTGDKPMTNIVESAESTASRPEGKTVHNVPKSKSNRPKAEKKMSKTTDTPKINLQTIIGDDRLELWTKRVKFDHVEVDVQAHALLFVGTDPRKLCFNTYDGALGKKADVLPVREFIEDVEVNTEKKSSRKPWFQIKDLEKARTQLKKSGYERTINN